MTRNKPTPSRRALLKGTAASAAIAPFFIGRSASAGDAEFTMKFATVAPTGTPWDKLAKKFKKHVSAKSGERVKVKLFMGGSTGDEIATAEAVKRGTMQACGLSFGALASAVPEVGCLELPYLFKSGKQAYLTLSKIRTELHDLLADRGYKLALFSQNGFRSIGSTFAINSISDLKGRKMRSLQAKEHLDTWKAFGASPTPIAITELLSSLQTGVVEGYDNTKLYTFAAALHVATTHFTLTDHIFQPACVLFSMKFWNKLPKDLQEALATDTEEMIKMESRGIRSVIALDGAIGENFKAAGITVTTLEKSELAKFKKAAMPVHEKFVKRTSAAGKKLFKSVQAAM